MKANENLTEKLIVTMTKVFNLFNKPKDHPRALKKLRRIAYTIRNKPEQQTKDLYRVIVKFLQRIEAAGAKRNYYIKTEFIHQLVDEVDIAITGGKPSQPT